MKSRNPLMTEAILVLSIGTFALNVIAAWQRHVTVKEIRRKQAKREARG